MMFVLAANAVAVRLCDHCAMARPITSSRVHLVADRRASSPGPGSARVRRYRLARLRFDGRETGSETRSERFKRG